MFHPKATTYEQMEKKPKDKKFKQNAYEEIRNDDTEGNNIVRDVKKKNNTKENIYNFKLFD